jgi:hypothetical protein
MNVVVLRCLLILLCLVATACADFEVSVQGPTEPVPVGRLVKLTPEGPEGTDFGWGMPVGEYEVAEQAGKPVLFFSAETPGRVLFVLQAVAAPETGSKPEKTLVFFWLDVLGSDGKPAPTPGPSPVSTIPERTRRAFLATDGTLSDQARADAKSLHVSLMAVADVLDSKDKDGKDKISHPGQLAASIETALGANEWTKGRYPVINVLFGELLGTNVKADAFGEGEKARFSSNLRAIAAGAKLAADMPLPKGAK